MPYPGVTNTGSYVPTTNVWDVGEVYNVEDISPDLRELLVRLYQNLNVMSLVLNTKISGYYVLEEFVNSSLYFNPSNPSPINRRNEYIKVIDTGALGAGASTFAHSLTIDANWNLTQLYGAGSYYDAGTPANSRYFPFPYVSPGGANDISLGMDNTNVLITNNSGITFDRSMVIIKYLKN